MVDLEDEPIFGVVSAESFDDLAVTVEIGVGLFKK
jgi:hypothetical protein